MYFFYLHCRKPVIGKRSIGEEKRDPTKSSSDSDSEKYNRSAPNSSGNSRYGPVTAARMVRACGSYCSQNGKRVII